MLGEENGGPVFGGREGMRKAETGKQRVCGRSATMRAGDADFSGQPGKLSWNHENHERHEHSDGWPVTPFTSRVNAPAGNICFLLISCLSWFLQLWNCFLSLLSVARHFERFLFPAGESTFDLFHVIGGREVASQFGLDFLDGGQAAAKFGGEGFGDLGFPVGDGDGFVQTAQGILIRPPASPCGSASGGSVSLRSAQRRACFFHGRAGDRS